MALEYRAFWNSGGSNPGFSVFHGRSQGAAAPAAASQDLADRVRLLFDALKAWLPSDFVFTFASEVLDYNTSTGVLEDVHAVTAPAAVNGAAAGVYSAPSGGRIEWRTSAIVSGRRLRGRTYIVPMASTAYQADGTLATGAISALTTAANAYIDDSQFQDIAASVWSRTHGIMADITAVRIPDEASVLRSRRD